MVGWSNQEPKIHEYTHWVSGLGRRRRTRSKSQPSLLSCFPTLPRNAHPPCRLHPPCPKPRHMRRPLPHPMLVQPSLRTRRLGANQARVTESAETVRRVEKLKKSVDAF